MLNELRSDVNDRLHNFFKSCDSDVAKIVSDFTLQGGKRIRPILVVTGYTCFCERDNAIVDVSITMELLHSCLLIHDDLLDDSDTRRGEPAVHTRYDRRERGVAAAVLSGDLSLTLAFEPLLHSDFSQEQVLNGIDLLTDIMATECEGEWKDVQGENVDEASVLELYKHKTACYTTTGPLQLGAVLAGVSRDAFTNIGRDLGVAYQIKDDIKGVFGASGKPARDVEEGKRSLLLAKTLQECTSEEEKFLKQRYGTGDAVDEVRDLFHKYALDYCQEQAQSRVNRARRSISDGWRQDGVALLQEVCDVIEAL